MFDFLLGRKKFDPALGDRLGSVILKEARQGKVTTLLGNTDRLRAGAWDDRAFYFGLASEHLASTSTIEQLPDTAAGNLLRGDVAIKAAWAARGSGTADTVSDGGWDVFFRYLNIAGKHLMRAAEQDSEDPTPFALLQIVAKGLQLDRTVAQEWLGEAVSRDPLNQQAHYNHLFLLAEKWGGSHAEMYAFARATMKRVPPSSTLYPIIFLAYQEHYLYLRAFDNNIIGARALLLDQSVRQESVNVYEQSLHQRQRIDHVSDYWSHNVAAWWFLMLNIPTAVRQETKKIGPHFTQYPWALFFQDPASGYQKAVRL